MAYCLSIDVEIAAGGPEELAQLCDHDGDGVADETVIARAIERADALINTYAAKRYAPPFLPPVPSEIVTRSAELAVYYLRKWRHILSDDERAEYDQHVAWLRDLADGRVVPGVAPSPLGAVSADEVILADTTTFRRTGRDKLRGFS